MLVVCNREKREHIFVPNVRRIRVAVDARGISSTLPDPTTLTYFASKLKRGLPDELAIHYEAETDGLYIYYEIPHD